MLHAGERVVHLHRLSWGVGQVLEDSDPASALIFFEHLGRAEVELADLQFIETAGSPHPIMDTLLDPRVNWTRARHNVYVILLDRDILRHRRFLRANPDYRGEKPCLYVGMTGLDPQVRFENHKQGTRSNSFVQRHGIRLIPNLYENFNPMPYRLAQVVEIEYAQYLRVRGYAVWQH